MKWSFTDDRPIYSQLIEQIKIGIITGVFPPGSNIPSVRTLAMEAEVNPNTMQKALAELEEEGLLHAQRTSGRFVTEDENMVEKLKQNLAKEHVEAFLNGMKSLGIDSAEAAELIISTVNEMKQKEVN